MSQDKLPPTIPSPDLAKELARLRKNFLSQLGTRIEAIESEANRLTRGNWNTDAAHELHALAYKLASIAGTFGGRSLGQAANRLVLLLLPYLGEAPQDKSLRVVISRTVMEVIYLAQAMQRGRRLDDAPSKRTAQPINALVYLVEDDRELAAAITARLMVAGYTVREFHDIAEFTATCKNAVAPAAVIMDIIFPCSADAGMQAIAECRLHALKNVPVIFVSMRNDIEARLGAMRAGGVRYLTKPLDLDRLTRVLDELSGIRLHEPYRVLLVDDDADLLAQTSAVLRSAGMTVSEVSRSLDALEVAHTFQPDVIVLDVYMPEVTGLELAALLREEDRFTQTPILFLSSETDLHLQLIALDLSAEAFLVKPIDPVHLTTAVRVHAKRARKAQALSEHLTHAMRENEYQKFALDQHAIVSVADPTGVILYVNDKFCQISGYSFSELIGQNHRIVKSDQHPAAFYEEMWLTISSGKVWQGVVCNRRKNGDHYWVESTIVPFLDEHGLPYQYVSIRTDVTDIMQIEAALRKERDFSDAAINALPGIFYVLSQDGRFLRFNDNLVQISGYTPQEIEQMSPLDFFCPQDKERMAARIARVFTDGHASAEADLVTKSGVGIPFYLQGASVDFKGQHCLIGSGIDLSTIKHTLVALQTSEERLRRSQNYANIGTWDWNIQTGELIWSERIAPLFGYPEGNLETTYANFLAAVHADDRQAVIDAVNACIERRAEYHIEHRCVWPDGTVRWLMERGDVTRAEDGTPLHMLGVVQDITSRKNAQLALAESRARLEEAQNLAHLGNWEADMVTGELRWSEEIFRIFGQDPAIFKPSVQAFFQAVHPDDVVLVRESELCAEKTGIHDVVHRIIRPDGAVRYVHELAHSQLNRESQVARLMGTVQDVSDLKQAELALIAARDEAERANRAKSEFLSSMSHELRTPMNAILGFAQLLEVDDALNADQADSVKEILKGGRHLLVLINEVLDLAKIEAGRIDLSSEPVPCESVVKEAINLVKPIADNQGITLEWDACADIMLLADPRRVKQVLINLLSNAVKYNKPHGAVRLEAFALDSGHARLQVTDTGPGIPATQLADLFQPFQRLGAEQSDVEGTGIGLVISKRLIEMMGGAIGVESHVGQGSTFWIELPLDNSLEDTYFETPAMDTVDTQSLHPLRTILYIEDNPSNLKLIAQVLRKRPSFHLLTAPTPAIGLELAATKNPDLILLDINMPGMGGYEVLTRLRAQDRAQYLPIIAVTANAMPSDIARGLAAGFDDYLAKPIVVPLFLATIDRFLSKHPRSNPTRSREGSSEEI
ncbi:MAG: response regulator [Burkholderiales bacterium]|nr:response regulator [Burkholderiales bacterium]